MNTILVFRLSTVVVAAAALALFSSVSAAQAPALKLPNAVVPTGYQVDVFLDPAKPDFAGSIAIAVDIREPVHEIWLHAHNIKVVSAKLETDGKSRKANAVNSAGDYLKLEFAVPVAVGKATLRIRYTGAVAQDSDTGIFHVKDDSDDYLFTQFEATDARSAFPCFDEPGFKTPWKVTLRIPAGDKAISNTPITRQFRVGKQQVVEFRETKPLPSYLVAFGVGPFEFVEAGKAGRSGAPVRIVTPKGKTAEARYAAEITATVLTWLEDYFGIPYPYEKADQVAIPVTIGFGAMENPGMVTYRQTLILARPESDTIERRRQYASTAAHELAHQWFGDLVTTAWWDDIWLNEAFATWMQQSMIAAWKPGWNTLVGDVNARLDVKAQDSLISARKIRQEIESRNDISNAFDGITYQKGAAVIGMFEHYMGAADFRTGVQQYMKQHAFGTATASDFLAALNAVGEKKVAEPFSTFLNQPGVPLLSLDLRCDGDTPNVHLKQQRLLPIGSTGLAAQTWSVPVCLRYPVSGGSRSECILLSGAALDYPLTAAAGSCPAWIQANDRALGYYVVDYRGKLLDALVSDDVTHRLDAAERVDLLGSAKLLADAGKLPADGALRLVENLSGEDERYVVQKALDLALSYHANLVPASLVPSYQRFLLGNFGARARALGWVARSGEPDDVKLLRPNVVGAVATIAGEEELAQTGRMMASQWLAGSGDVAPEMLQTVLSTGAFYGDKQLAERYLAKLKGTEDRQLRRKIINSMSSFRDPAAIEVLYQAILSGNVLFMEGGSLLFAGQEYEDTRYMALANLQAHFDEVLAKRPKGTDSDFAARLPNVGRRYCDRESRQKLQQFFEFRAPTFAGGPRMLAQVLEEIDLCIARKEAQGTSIAAYLQSYSAPSGQ